MESEYLPSFIVYKDRVYACMTPVVLSMKPLHIHTYIFYKPQTRQMSIPPLLFVSDPVVVDTKDVILYKENHLKKVLFQEGFKKRA